MLSRVRLRHLIMVTSAAAILFAVAPEANACGACTRTEVKPCGPPCEAVRLVPGYFICETQRVCVSPGYWRTHRTPPVTQTCFDICGRPITRVISPGECRREWIPPRYEDRVIRKWVAPRWERVRVAPPVAAPMPRPVMAPRPLPAPRHVDLTPPAPAPRMGCNTCQQKKHRCDKCRDKHNHGGHRPFIGPGEYGHPPHHGDHTEPAEPASWSPTPSVQSSTVATTTYAY